VASQNELQLVRTERTWRLAGEGAGRLGLMNDYLGYLADRNYSSHTVRAYALDLLVFARWLASEGVELSAITTDVLLRYLAAPPPRSARRQRLFDRRWPQRRLLAGDHQRRLAAISGLFAFWAMRDPGAPRPVPKGREARRAARGELTGMLGHLARRPKARSALRLREPRRLPRGLDPREAKALVASFHTWRDRAIAGLMLYSGLRSAEVLGLSVSDVDIGRGWALVKGKGDKERRVPIDVDVVGAIQTYLLAERPETTSMRLFVVAKGPNRGQPLTPAGLRTVFRYHRARSSVRAGHPHALRHTFGTALAEAGVDLAVMQALLGHDHVDATTKYIHLAPAHVRAQYDAARARQRAQAQP
jgi:site-specific recombinase XerD